LGFPVICGGRGAVKALHKDPEGIEAALRFLDRLSNYLVLMGIPGLLAIAFLDSAAVPMVGGPDAIVVLLAWQRPSLVWLIALAGALGSTLGCLVLYSIGRKGGERALSRFGPSKVEWVKRKMDEYGVWAVFASVLAPPPFPTKPVILAAGVLQTGKAGFTASVLVGRFARYFLAAYLGARFGERAAQVLKANYPLISIVLIALIFVVYIVRYLRNTRRAVNDDILPPS
jgi:membrane protein YqaA with SNARE-associated domain